MINLFLPVFSDSEREGLRIGVYDNHCGHRTSSLMNKSNTRTGFRKSFSAKLSFSIHLGVQLGVEEGKPFSEAVRRIPRKKCPER